jgi:N-methylhydantoinase A/oxoprolinase/acetone carboxylase beta subunit
VFERRDLVVGDKISGPALIAEPQTTTYVPAIAEAVVDEMSNLVIALRAGIQ